MTDDLRTAFDHPLARAEAMGAPLDRISLRDHVALAEIGAFEVERGVTQRLRFDIVVEVRPLGDTPQDVEDDVDHILSYDRLAEAVAAELAAERMSLLETLADRVAARILREPQAERVFLRVQKLDRGPGDLGVEIVRARKDTPKPGPASAMPRPRMAVLAPAAGARVPDLLARPEGPPLLLCVAGPGSAPPTATTPAAQRRIDLLALDQAAWALASGDARLTVAATRTELDWALRRGTPCVWAPSRMVLDAVGGPQVTDALALAAWLAKEIDAVEFRLIGLTRPEGFAAAVPWEAAP